MGKRLAGTLLAVVLLISFGAAYGEEYPVDVSGMKAAVLCSQDGQSIIEYNSAERLEVGGLGRLPLLLAAEVEAKAKPVKAEAAEGVVLGTACAGAAAVAAIAAGASLLVALGVVDLVVGGVDLIHLPSGLRIIGMEVGVVFLRQGAVCFFDFVRAGIG